MAPWRYPVLHFLRTGHLKAPSELELKGSGTLRGLLRMPSGAGLYPNNLWLYPELRSGLWGVVDIVAQRWEEWRVKKRVEGKNKMCGVGFIRSNVLSTRLLYNPNGLKRVQGECTLMLTVSSATLPRRGVCLASPSVYPFGVYRSIKE